MIDALVGHLVGDYLLQNDFLAMNKKRSSDVCFIHCTIWTVCVLTFAGWWAQPFAALFLFACHFAQDRTGIIRWSMQKMGQEQFATGACSPWSIIVVDNVWHIVQIWIAWKFLLVEVSG